MALATILRFRSWSSAQINQQAKVLSFRGSVVPFPRPGGVCTRFATEIILRHEPRYRRNTATIMPHISRSEDERVRLSALHREVPLFPQLPGIINEAASLMGVQGDNGLG